MTTFWITIAVASALVIGFLIGYGTCAVLSAGSYEDAETERILKNHRNNPIIEEAP